MSPLSLLLLIAAAFCADVQQSTSNATTTPSPLKSDAAEGHRKYYNSYEDDYYGGGYGHRHAPIVLDNYVCDLDASVLLVLSRSRGPLHKAHRVRCSDVSEADEDSCTVCCQNAARRDLTLKNEDIVGILTNSEGFKGSPVSEEKGRYKRNARRHSHEYKFRDNLPNAREYNYESSPNYYKNIRCLCCAPRRAYNGPEEPILLGTKPVALPISAPTHYYPNPPQPSYPAPAYQPPAAAPPTYSPPQPAYQPPARDPNYQQPTYKPTYKPAAAPPAPPVAAAPTARSY